MPGKKFCLILGCKEKPDHCLKGEKKSTHCKTHKTEKMIKIGRRICEFEDCLTV